MGSRGDDPVTQEVAGVIEEFRRSFAAQPVELALLDRVNARLLAPLRVGICGSVSSGKSTLVNALLGNVVAATGAGETTRLLTWFHGGDVERAELVMVDGSRRPLYLTEEGRLPDRLERDVEDVASVHVTLPTAPLLRHLTLVDTPGLFSLRDENSARSRQALAGDENGSELDALIFLTSGQQAELDALADFCAEVDGRLSGASNVIAVVSKVDQIGGSEDPLVAGQRKAVRLKAEPQLRLLVSEVLPVLGLLAESTRTDALREADLAALRRLAGDESATWSLLSAELMVRASAPELLGERERLVDLLGLHGLRLAVAGLREDPSLTLPALSGRLLEQSGFSGLEHAVWQIFVPRADTLKIDRAVSVLAELSGRAAAADRDRLRTLVEGCLVTGAGQAVRVLDALRRVQLGEVAVPGWVEDALVSTAGSADIRHLLALAPHASAEEVRGAAEPLLTRLQAHANAPLVPARSSEVARLVQTRIAGLLTAGDFLVGHERAEVAVHA